MKYINYTILLLLILLVSCKEAKKIDKVKNNDIENSKKECISKDKSIIDIQGVWIVSEENSFAKLDIKELQDVFFSVMSNQIYINAKIKKNNSSEKMYDLFLISPDDLGSGGVRLDWENFSKEEPIAKIEIKTNGELNFNWLGFYNNKLKKRTFLECEFNLLSESNPTVLIKQ